MFTESREKEDLPISIALTLLRLIEIMKTNGNPNYNVGILC